MSTSYIRNQWYPVAWCREVGTAPVARRLIEEDLVVFRGDDGGLRALADLCPHKLAPLSLGTVVGNHLRCGYHGIAFDGEGRCAHSPTQDRPPASLKVRAYPVAQSMGLVWVWPGDPALAAATPVFDLPQYHDPAYSLVEGDALQVKANYLSLADNLCDPTHVAYVHQSTLSNAQHGPVPLQFERLKDRVVTWRWIEDGPLIPIFQGLKDFGGNVDRWHYYHYHPPCVAVIDFGSARTGTGAPQGNRSDCLQMFACHFITPVDARHCVQHWLCLKNLPADPEVDRRLLEGLRMAFDEDKVILEAIQRNEDRHPGVRGTLIPGDASSVQMRRMVDERIRAERETPASVAAAA
jgi:vanillate O-demethylase monooxygenase subunit